MFEYNVTVDTKYGRVTVQFVSDVNCLTEEEIYERAINELQNQTITTYEIIDLDKDTD